MKQNAASSHFRQDRRRPAAWFFWIILLLLTGAAAMFRASVPVAAAFLVCLLLPGISLFFSRLVRKHLSAGITLPLSAAKNAYAEGILTLRNDGLPACGRVSVLLTVTNALTGEERKQQLLLSAPSFGSASVQFTVSSAHCGALECTAADAVLYDWFGLFRLRASLQASGTVLILPDTFPVEIQDSPVFPQTSSPEEQDSIRGTEDPSEIRGLREYRAGDPVRQIHWKLSAKQHIPILKENGMPVSRTLLLFWDKLRGTEPAVTDALAEAVCSLALGLCRQQIPFTFGWRGQDGTELEIISDEDTAVRAVSLALRHGSRPGSPENSGADGPLTEAQGYTRALWFAGAYPFASEAFLSAESIVYLCGKEPPDRGSRLTVFFSPEETRETLRLLRL